MIQGVWTRQNFSLRVENQLSVINAIVPQPKTLPCYAVVFETFAMMISSLAWLKISLMLQPQVTSDRKLVHILILPGSWTFLKKTNNKMILALIWNNSNRSMTPPILNTWVYFFSNFQILNIDLDLTTNLKCLCVLCVVLFSFVTGVLTSNLSTHLRILSCATLLTHWMTLLSLSVAKRLICVMKT